MLPSIASTLSRLDTAYGYAWRQLFDPRTNLFYDYISDRDPNRKFRHLPSPDEISMEIPNPCGWGTGMEDCMLHAGSMIDVLALRRDLLGEENTQRAELLVDGICRCATIHGHHGFIARGVSPRDGKSCYANSSRDQFTLAVYGLWRFLRCFPDASISSARKTVETLRQVADFCHTRITPENGFSLGRLDGGPAVVSTIWQCAPHEMMRIPMFYAAAFEATGEERFRAYAAEYAMPGLKATLEMDSESYWWDIPLAQMQISLSFFAETGIFPELTAELKQAMNQTAALAEHDFTRKLEEAEQYHAPWETINQDWRTMPMEYQSVVHAPGGRENRYANPRFPAEFNRPNTLLRAFGNDLIALSLGKGVLSDSKRARLNRVLDRVEIARCGGSGPIQLQHGLGLAYRNEITMEHTPNRILQENSNHR